MKTAAANRTRLLLNLVSFIKSHPGVLLEDLAEQFTMPMDDMYTLLMAEVLFSGVPPYSPSDYLSVWVYETPRGLAVRLHMHEELKTPVRLTSAEALALKGVLESYTRAAPPEVKGVADVLLEKISESLGPSRDSALTGSRSVAVGKQTPNMRELLARIDEAITRRRMIAFDYFSASRGELARRTVQPWSLFEEGSRFYLRGWCMSRSEARSFRVDRMKELEVSGVAFERPVDADKLERAVPGYDGTTPKGRFTVRFEPAVAEDVAQEWAPLGGKTNFERDGSLLLSLPLYSEAWAVGWVLSFGCHAELVSPLSLRRELISRAKAMLGDKRR